MGISISEEENEMYNLIKSGNLASFKEKFEKYRKDNKDVDYQYETHEAVIVEEAVKNGNVEIVKYLMEKGANPVTVWDSAPSPRYLIRPAIYETKNSEIKALLATSTAKKLNKIKEEYEEQLKEVEEIRKNNKNPNFLKGFSNSLNNILSVVNKDVLEVQKLLVNKKFVNVNNFIRTDDSIKKQTVINGLEPKTLEKLNEEKYIKKIEEDRVKNELEKRGKELGLKTKNYIKSTTSTVFAKQKFNPSLWENDRRELRNYHINKITEEIAKLSNEEEKKNALNKLYQRVWNQKQKPEYKKGRTEKLLNTIEKKFGKNFREEIENREKIEKLGLKNFTKIDTKEKIDKLTELYKKEENRELLDNFIEKTEGMAVIKKLLKQKFNEISKSNERTR